MNIVPGRQTGRPVWECMPKDAENSDAFTNAYETGLGRMVPLTRMILLPGESGTADCIIGPVPKKYVFSNEPDAGHREPYCTLKISKDNSLYYMPVNVSRHIWRELGSVLSLKKSTENFAALNLQNAVHGGNHVIDVWCGGLAKGATAAKIYDMAEWNFSVPVSLFEASELGKYVLGVELASSAEYALKNASQNYAKTLKVQGGGYSRNAVAQFWSALDSSYKLLIDIAADLERDLDDWRTVLRQAMFRAFDSACPHQTPRQIQAYAQARKLLRIKERNNAPTA